MPPPGLYSKRQGWTGNCIRYTGRTTNHGKRAAMYVWHDEYGLHAVGSEEMVKQFKSSDWKESANKDTRSLANGSQVVPIDDKMDNVSLIKAHLSNVEVTLLPAPIEFMSHQQCYRWLVCELKRDLMEQDKPCGKVPWGQADKEPKCWPSNFVHWTRISNPSEKQKIPLPSNYQLVHLFKQAVRNRLKLKGDLLFLNIPYNLF